MRAVDVGVGHDDDLVVAQLSTLKSSRPMPVPSAVISVPICSEPSILSKRARSTLRILPRKRQHRLEFAVAALLGAAAGRIALDDEQFGFGGIALLAVGELAGQRGDIERALARVSSRALRAASRAAAASTTLPTMTLASADAPRTSRQSLVDHVLDHRAHFRGHQLVLGLRGEFRVGHFDRQHRGQALAAIVAGQRDLFALGDERSAYCVTWRVSAPRKPARWVPPSRCGMLLVKHSTFS
jgi:hypothetical protein